MWNRRFGTLYHCEMCSCQGVLNWGAVSKLQYTLESTSRSCCSQCLFDVVLVALVLIHFKLQCLDLAKGHCDSYQIGHCTL